MIGYSKPTSPGPGVLGRGRCPLGFFLPGNIMPTVYCWLKKINLPTVGGCETKASWLGLGQESHSSTSVQGILLVPGRLENRTTGTGTRTRLSDKGLWVTYISSPSRFFGSDWSTRLMTYPFS